MPSNAEDSSDQENVENKIQIEEDSTYPLDNNITYRERMNKITKRSFNYIIIKEGVYPNGIVLNKKNILETSNESNKFQKKTYKIPHGYVVKTTWGRAAKKRTVCCEIDYINAIPQFRIKYGSNFQHVISSTKSATDAAIKYERSLKPGTKAKISGPILFGLQLDSVRKARESRKRGNLIKPAINCTPSTLEKRAKKLATKIQSNIKNDVKGVYHQSDQVILNNIEFSVNKKDCFQVNYGPENEINKTHKLRSVVKAVDQGQISRESYRELAAVEANLPRENSVSNERIAITDNMNQLIKISLVDMNGRDKLEEALGSDESEFRNPEITQEAIDIMGIGIYRSIKDILNYIIPYLKEKKVLRLSDTTIHLRISGDGRNVGRKIKHVMLTFMILNHKERHHHADYHYTTVLYPGTENYNTLEFILNPFLNELRSLKENGLEAAGILWNFELYFSSDWKFLAICLGLNGPTSNFFCPWCSCSKHQHGDLSKDWRIEKNMEQIATRYEDVNGHIHPPLIDMIAINHIIFDELHVFLRITDRLWELVLAEIKERDLFNNLTREVIMKEMQRLKVSFCFWENKESHNWEYTFLMGDDKEKVLRFFNLKLLFRPSRAQLIRNLWDQFYQIYCAIRDNTTDPGQLKIQAIDWLSLFLTPSQGDPNDPRTFIQGLYLPSHVTPYIHALVYHGWELLEKHKRWGLKAFSCSAVEKKNHNQVSTFFRKTLKNGGNPLKRKSAIQEIIEYENRTLYNPLPESKKIKKLRIK
ncbi:hypothetical protein RhiirA1_497283 [Rhizophagus irregularis]|uniref:Transposase domain-containing protein n=1 Tax=Rhizophagus irregularis TaxID=588596 RepID=A0A2N0R3B6_9GLOM|nr:hypothetical protein RhiirA1_497283 [Rhizophagus irregularis]